MIKQSVQGVEEHVDPRTNDALGQTLREGATPVVTDNARAVGSAGEIADRAKLVASPNPVPAGPGAGLATITWAVPGATDAEVWVSVNAQPERHFARGPSGSAEAAWIEANQAYTFRVYAGTEHTGPALKSVVVIRDPGPRQRVAGLANAVTSVIFPRGGTTQHRARGGGSNSGQD